MGDLAKEFQENLHAIRLRKGISTKVVQEVGHMLAESTGVSGFAMDESSINRYEHSSWPTIPKLITLAKAYGVPIGDLLAPLLACPELCGQEPLEQPLDDLIDPNHRHYHTLLEFILEHGQKDRVDVIRVLLEVFFELLSRRPKRRDQID